MKIKMNLRWRNGYLSKVLLVLFVMVVISCEQETNDSNVISSLEETNLEGAITFSKGKTTIDYLANDVVISHEGVVERTFIAQNENATLRSLDMENTEIVYSKYSLVVYDLESKSIHSFNLETVSEAEFRVTKSYQLMDKGQVSVLTQRGLSIYHGLFETDGRNLSEYQNGLQFIGIDKKTQERASNNCELDACTSGGQFAIQCSTNDGMATFTGGCQVQCAAGAFACCNASSNRCYCCNDGSASSDPNGGSGGSSDGNGGGSGGTCIYILIDVRTEGNAIVIDVLEIC